MILTLTPNPSLDLLFGVERLVWDDANRTPGPRRRPGGQGINVVRAARALDPGAETLAIAPLGGAVGREIRDMLDAEGTPLEVIPLAGDSRVFVGVREAETGRSLLLNPRGPAVGAAEADQLLRAVERALDRALDANQPPSSAWVACCGSLLPGLDTDFYARVGRIAHDRGARFVPDCDGAPLAAAVEVADLLVPNEMEAGRLVGRAPGTPQEAAAAARELLDRGPDRVVITMGERGAVSVTAAGAWWASPVLPPELAQILASGSAVGAGDAFLAGLLLSRERGVPEEEPVRLARAVAAGTAALLSQGSDLVVPQAVAEVIPRISVERLDV